MRQAKPGTPFSTHPYDIELNDIYNRMVDALYSYDELVKELSVDFIKSQKNYFEMICEHNGFVYSPFLSTVVDSSDSSYNNCLALSLAFYDVNRIKQFLDYQSKQFKSRSSFVNKIEFEVYELAKDAHTLHDTSRVTEKIMEWVEVNRSNHDIDLTQKVVWLGTKKQLKDLSKRLGKQKFTRRQTDFEKVFTERKKSDWLKKPELLCYLLFKLRENDPALFKAEIGKGHYKAASAMFSGEFSRKLANKNYISYTINRFRYETSSKTVQERVSIDLMLKSALQKQ